MMNARLYQLLRDFALTVPFYGRAIRHLVKPDERLDASLVSYRVYGTREHGYVVRACAGVDSPELPLPNGEITLPTSDQLRRFKARAGVP